MRTTWTFECLARKQAGNALGGLETRRADRAHALLSASLDEPTKQLDIQARSTGRSRVPLDTEGKPAVGIRALPRAICLAGHEQQPVEFFQDLFAQSARAWQRQGNRSSAGLTHSGAVAQGPKVTSSARGTLRFIRTIDTNARGESRRGH